MKVVPPCRGTGPVASRKHKPPHPGCASTPGTTHLNDLGELLSRRHDLMNDRGLESGLPHDMPRSFGLGLGPRTLERQQTSSLAKKRRRKSHQFGQICNGTSSNDIETLLDVLGSSPSQGDIVQVELVNDVAEPINTSFHNFDKRNL